MYDFCVNYLTGVSPSFENHVGDFYESIPKNIQQTYISVLIVNIRHVSLFCAQYVYLYVVRNAWNDCVYDVFL